MSSRMPGGIPYILSNEVAERFSYYGMKGILVVFMTKHLVDSSGDLVVMGEEEAKSYFHLFTGGLILHGAHDNGGDGSYPTLAVTLSPTVGWQVHT